MNIEKSCPNCQMDLDFVATAFYRYECGSDIFLDPSKVNILSPACEKIAALQEELSKQANPSRALINALHSAANMAYNLGHGGARQSEGREKEFQRYATEWDQILRQARSGSSLDSENTPVSS